MCLLLQSPAITVHSSNLQLYTEGQILHDELIYVKVNIFLPFFRQENLLKQ